MSDPTRRFSNRVQDYVAYRPSYPPELLDVLASECGLGPASVIADVGSGTGKLTELLLAHGNTVFAVEPNDAMRHAAESLLGGQPGFRSVKGTAEETTLASGAIDLVVAGQAFHWFDREKTVGEFRRILRPPRAVALVWNTRDDEASAFLRDYDAFVQHYSVDYEKVSQRSVMTDEIFQAFFRGPFRKTIVKNLQRCDFDGVLGRYLSASYAYTRDDPRLAQAEDELRRAFDQHAVGGMVDFPYVTEIYTGSL